MGITNQYGEFTDTPVDQQWWMRFDVLTLPTDHRKILNRQPRTLSFRFEIVCFEFDLKVMSN